MRKTVNNVAIRNSLVAVARAHTQMPGFEMSKSIELARRIDSLAHEDQHMHVTVALAILLLKAIGVLDAFDSSRFARD